MKIKGLAALSVTFALLLSSCSEAAPTATGEISDALSAAASGTLPEKTTALPEKTDITTLPEPDGKPETTTAPVKKTINADSPAASRPDLSDYGENAEYYTADEIYIRWTDVGYVDDMPSLLMITNREQLEYAKERYPLYIPEGADENTRYSRFSPLIEPFAEMTERYPVEKYTYLLEYVRADGGGYHIIPAGLVVGEDRLCFINSPNSVYPERDDVMPDVCSDYCYMAAVPKEYLPEETYTGWLLPDPDDMCQDAHYDLTCLSYDTEDVYDIYGGTHYLMRTRAEYDDFLAMSAHLTTVNGRPVFPDMSPDFENEAVAAYFLTAKDIAAAAPVSGENKVIADGKTLTVNYGGIKASADRIATYMIYAVIPKRFLTEASYDGWQAPTHTAARTVETPAIDRSRYGKDTLILTADDIALCGTHTSCTDFSGKYVMCGDEGVSAVWDGLKMYKDNNFMKFVEMNRCNMKFEEYPKSENNVLFVQYNNPDCYGRDLRPYALVIDGKKAEFLYTENSSADKSDKRPDSYCFFAAVPEELLTDIHFDGWSVYDDTAQFGSTPTADDTPSDPGEMYYKEPKAEDILTEPKTGVRYVRDQLLVGAFPDADRNELESIFGGIGADIVGYIALTNDYQIEFWREMTLDDLQAAADILNSYAFVSNVTLNIVSDVSCS